MNKIELLQYLTKSAKSFRADADFYSRNAHMHTIKESHSQEAVDAVLTGFINHIGMNQGVDYGLYASDLAIPEQTLAQCETQKGEGKS